MSLPIACELDATALAARREGEFAALIASALHIQPIGEGVRVVLPGARAALEAAFRVITVERECCRFLRFRLELAPALGTVTLDVDGPPGTAAFLGDLGFVPTTPA